LRTIFRNLLENATKHSGRDDVSIEIRTGESPRGMVLVEFHDNGKGYSGDASKLGKLFHKGKGSMGTGVGLFLIRTLARRMGGTARFKARESGFSVEIELREASHG
jgi:signal transduction histidine kinase